MRWDVQIFYDAPRPQISVANAQSGGLSIEFSGLFAGQAAKLLIDTGATDNFVSPAFARQSGLTVTALEGVVVLANGSNARIAGTIKGKIRIGAHQSSNNCLVIDSLLEKFAVILGDKWMRQQNAIRDACSKTCTLRNK